MVLNELQLRYKANLPLRMRAYTGLAEEKYELPVLPVLINILPPRSSLKIADRYESHYFGLKAQQDYKVINLWEVDVQVIFEQKLNALLPFAPVLKGGDDLKTVDRALQSLRGDESLSDFEPLFGLFASFVLNKEVVNQLLRLDMAVLHESPWLQDLIQESEAKGEAKLLLRQLTRKFGQISPEIEARVRGLALADVEALGEALLDFSQSADLEDWFNLH